MCKLGDANWKMCKLEDVGDVQIGRCANWKMCKCADFKSVKWCLTAAQKKED
jgi:hypothetical protein